jgi:hypothetical protein
MPWSSTTGLGEKRLELLRELVPKATTIAVLVNPENPVSTAEATRVEADGHMLSDSTCRHVDGTTLQAQLYAGVIR